MPKIPFSKLSGCGNDFIIIDNRKKVVDKKNISSFILAICKRKISVGADGVILIENSEIADFRWHFFNSDGNIAEMCGNGARCAARFAYLNGITGSAMSFETIAGIVSARVADNGMVTIKTTDPVNFFYDYYLELNNSSLNVSSINTGVPHVVVSVDDLDKTEVFQLGRDIRFHTKYSPAGTNVNFVYLGNNNSLAIRTYERGVENETLACGTGAIASALVMACKEDIKSPVRVITRSGGTLIVHFKGKKSDFHDVYLEGDARIIFDGTLWEDAWCERND